MDCSSKFKTLFQKTLLPLWTLSYHSAVVRSCRGSATMFASFFLCFENLAFRKKPKFSTQASQIFALLDHLLLIPACRLATLLSPQTQSLPALKTKCWGCNEDRQANQISPACSGMTCVHTPPPWSIFFRVLTKTTCPPKQFSSQQTAPAVRKNDCHKAKLMALSLVCCHSHTTLARF